MVFVNCSKEDVIHLLTVKEIAQTEKDDAVLKKLSKTDKYSMQVVEDTRVLCKDVKWPFPEFFRTKQLAGTTTICSILDTHILKRHYISDVLERYENTIRLHVKNCHTCKLTNDTSTSMGNSLLSLSSNTLVKHCMWTSLDLTLSKVKMG